jgi:hypothetical protein
MADKKISELTTAAALAGDELLELVQAADNTKVTLDVLLSGPPKNGTTVNYSDGFISEVLVYSDSAKTALYRKYVMVRTSGQISSIEIRNPANTLLQTITLSYTGSQITGSTTT